MGVVLKIIALEFIARTFLIWDKNRSDRPSKC